MYTLPRPAGQGYPPPLAGDISTELSWGHDQRVATKIIHIILDFVLSPVYSKIVIEFFALLFLSFCSYSLRPSALEQLGIYYYCYYFLSFSLKDTGEDVESIS